MTSILAILLTVAITLGRSHQDYLQTRLGNIEDLSDRLLERLILSYEPSDIAK